MKNYRLTKGHICSAHFQKGHLIVPKQRANCIFTAKHEISVGNHDAKRSGFQLIDKMVSSLSIKWFPAYRKMVLCPIRGRVLLELFYKE